MAVFVSLYAWASRFGIARKRENQRRASRADAAAIGTATDALINYETVKFSGGEHYLTEQIHAGTSQSEGMWRSFFLAQFQSDLLLSGVFNFALLIMLLLVAWRVAYAGVTPGDFVLVNAYALQMITPVEGLGAASREISQSLIYTERLSELMAEHPEDAGGDVLAALAGEAPLDVRVQNLHFGYVPDRAVLRDLDLNIRPGESVAIVGASGSGKSTIVRLLFRLYLPTSGRILINGQCISGISLSSLRSAIAVVPQDTLLFHETIADNIAIGSPTASLAEIAEAASLAGLDEVLSRLPDGWDTMVGERGFRLSGGERQRVAIARAVLRRPRLFIFDEATSSLDSRTESLIQSSLRAASTGVTTLIIAHRLSTVYHANEIVVLGHGQIIERGTHDMLIKADGQYAAMWRAQQRVPS